MDAWELAEQLLKGPNFKARLFTTNPDTESYDASILEDIEKVEVHRGTVVLSQSGIVDTRPKYLKEEKGG
jgi:hypothetical protein